MFQPFVGRQPAAYSRRAATTMLLAMLAGCVRPPTALVLSSDDQLAIAQITGYLNGLTSFEARFTQTGPDGYSAGQVWLARPGRLRVDYTAPHPKLMLANHGRLLLANLTTGATTTLPVARTPLDILLAPVVQLTGDVTITGLQRLPSGLQLSLVKTAAPGQGTLTLRFAANPLSLQGVTILDHNGNTTAFDLVDLRPNVAVDPARFEYHAPVSN